MIQHSEYRLRIEFSVSEVKEAVYTLKVETPAFDPSGGSIPPTAVAVSCDTPDTAVKYAATKKQEKALAKAIEGGNKKPLSSSDTTILS